MPPVIFEEVFAFSLVRTVALVKLASVPAKSPEVKVPALIPKFMTALFPSLPYS